MNPDLAEAFASGLLVRPSYQQPDLVHLVRALATLAGVKEMDRSPATRRLLDLIGPAEHHVFVLLDGLGMNIIQRLPSDSFLASHLTAQIYATSPSTTASALTSVATGYWPNRHAITGWFTYLPEFELTCTILPFTERFSQQSLTLRGIRAGDVLPLSAFYQQMTHRALTLLPAQIVNTTYATYSRGYTPGLGYGSFADAIDQIIAHVRSATEPTHVHLYAPDIDTACHKIGWDHPNIEALVMQMDVELARLADALTGRARIIVSADHGLINVPKHDQALLFHDDPMLELLRTPPSGDARMPIFHVREERRQSFIDMFQQRFADRMVLLDIDEVERLQLFGPGPFSPVAKRRFGDYVAVAHRPVTLSYFPPGKSMAGMYYAQHAGLSPDEMIVPLCIA